jgi:hypothetical protein
VDNTVQPASSHDLGGVSIAFYVVKSVAGRDISSRPVEALGMWDLQHHRRRQ